MFLQVCVILFTGGRSPEKPPRDQADPPGRENPPRTRQNPPREGELPPGRRLQHTVNERPVRILVECILVYIIFTTMLVTNGFKPVCQLTLPTRGGGMA